MKSTYRIIVAALASCLLAYAQVSAEAALRSAMELETVKGDLRGAIQRYAKLAEGKDRAVAAKALLRMAQCHEKLGDAEARRIYERLVRDFGDQTQAVAQARTKLGAATRSKGDRVVWSGKDVEHAGGNISPDGRWVSYTDFWHTGNLMVHDLVTGMDRSLTPEDDWSRNGNSEGGAFSPDSQKIAYGWLTYNPRHIEIRILNPAESGVPKPTTIISDAAIAHLDVNDWSGDGKLLAVTWQRRDLITRLGVVQVQDGKLRELKQLAWRGPTRVEFSPDGKFLAFDQPVTDTAVQRDLHIIRTDGGGDVTIAAHEANDVFLGWSQDGSRLLFRSDRGGSDGLYSISVRNGNASGVAELVKPDVGPVFALGRTASGALHLYKDISTKGLYTAPIDLTTGKFTGSPVIESYRSVGSDWSRDGRLLAFRMQADGVNYLAVQNRETGQLKKFPTQMNWITELRFAPDGKWLVAGAREFTGKAGLYRFDAATGAATRIVEESHTNRAQVSPDGSRIYHEAARPRRSVERDLASGATRDIVTQRPNTTTSGKELSPDGRYIAGVMTSPNKSSSLVVIPVAGGELREVLTLTQAESFADSRVAWMPDSKAVIAIKAIGERKEFWLIPVEGGQPRKLDLAIPDFIGGLRIHPSGRQIAFEAGEQKQEIWAWEQPAAHATGRR